MHARITILAFVLLAAGAASASAGAPVEGALPPKEGAISPLRPEAIPEAERELKLGTTAGRTALHVTLPPASRPERSAQAPGRGPVAVASHREMPERFQGDLSSRLEWTPLDDGSIAAAVSVTSPGATDLRLGVLVDLSPGGELRFFGAGADGRFPVVTRADLARKGGEPQILWSPVVEGDTIGVEITLPSRAALPALSFRVGRISHGHEAERAFESGQVPGARQCLGHLIDYQCGVGRHFPEPRGNSAASLRFERSGSGYVCSGTLLNDNDDRSFIPYVLTARHCISTPDVAATLSVRWFYQRSACGVGTLDSRYATTSGGAELLATSVISDATLLRLRGSVPGGLLYSGWNPNRITHPRDVHLFHHPDGDVKRYSVGRTTGYGGFVSCDDPNRGIGCANRKGIDTAWSEGSTEGGSSGGGLFDGQHLIGVHSGIFGRSSCADLGHGYAGAFSDFYPRIRRWLEARPPPPQPPPPPPPPPPPTVTLSASPSPVTEGSPVTVTARLSRALSGAVTIPVTVRRETSEAGDHGTLSSIAIAAGETSATGTIATHRDADGADETFTVALGALPSQVTAGTPSSVTVTIDDDALGVAAPAPELAFFPAASGTLGGLARVVNRSDESGTVRVRAFDDAGEEYPAQTLTLSAGQAMGFRPAELEAGHEAKGLTGTGAGAGNWRLVFESALDLRVFGLVRQPDGGLAPVHDRAPGSAAGGYEVVFFNPAGNRRFASRLRLVNRSGARAAVTIAGTDSAGEPGESPVTLTVPARAACTLRATELESGAWEGDAPGPGCGALAGRLGDGAGKWRLMVTANQPLSVMSLLRSASGHLTNLSSAPAGAGAGAHRLALLPPADDAPHQDFVWLVNRDARAGTVTVRAFDDAGAAYPVQSLTLGAGQATGFSAAELEEGNAERGFTGAGDGAGSWHLVFEPEPADLDLQALAYARNSNPLVSLAALHDTAPGSPEAGWEVAFFNPASNRGLQSRLRLVNRADAPAAVTIAGTDALAQPGESPVTLTLPARAACTLRAPVLESGAWEAREPGPGCGALAGALGDGAGKWRLVVTADQPLAVMSLLRHAASGALANLSTARE